MVEQFIRGIKDTWTLGKLHPLMEQILTKNAIFGSEMSFFKIKTSVMRGVQEIICQELKFVK